MEIHFFELISLITDVDETVILMNGVDLIFGIVSASLGGMFGLCLGGSFISLVEIVYFLLIRSVGNILLRYNKPKKDEPTSAPKLFIISNKVRSLDS